jgi:hypothetical protein
LAPSEAHTDTIIPKALLDNIPKRDEMKDSKEGWEARISKYTHEFATHWNNSFSTKVMFSLSPTNAKVQIYQMASFTQCDQWLN